MCVQRNVTLAVRVNVSAGSPFLLVCLPALFLPFSLISLSSVLSFPHFFVSSLRIFWLKYYATRRKAAGSIPDDVIEIILPHYRPGSRLSLLTVMIARDIYWGKGG